MEGETEREGKIETGREGGWKMNKERQNRETGAARGSRSQTAVPAAGPSTGP